MIDTPGTYSASWTRKNKAGVDETVGGWLEVRAASPTHLIHLSSDFAEDFDEFSFLTGAVRSEFFSNYCRVTADVLWEAKGHPQQVVLLNVANEASPTLLEQVRAVMATVKTGDTALVDLYKNKGTADPGLIAAVLDAITADEGLLFRDTWVLVTNDHAVEEKAAEFSIATIKPVELVKLIDTSMT